MNKNEEWGDDLFDVPEIIDDENVGQRRSYQSALNGIATINLNYVQEKLGYDDFVSDYSMCSNPDLEMQGDLDLLQECIDKLALLEKALDKACECLDEYQYIYEHEVITGNKMLSLSSKEDWKAFVFKEMMEEEK